MHGSFALCWVLDFASFAAASLSAPWLHRGGGLALLGMVLLVWAGGLVAYGAWLGAPELTLVFVGLPFTVAAVRTRQLARRGLTLRQQQEGAILACGVAVPIALALGLWWGIEACQGGCL